MRGPNPALPFDDAEQLFLHPGHARETGKQYANEYQFAEPFPHIVFDDFLPSGIAKRILAEFPATPATGEGVVSYELGYVGGKHKKQFDPNFITAPFTRALFQFLNSASLLQFLEGLTGIDGLISDPYFDGGGFHEISQGGRLGIHADFRILKKLSVQRRMNLLLYLNENWQSSWGGSLELWDRNMRQRVRSVEPVFNRCVIFNTEADSFHGHPDPLNVPANVTRKSIALYYYTASKAVYQEVHDRPTDYRVRPNDNAHVKYEKSVSNLKKHLRDWTPPALVRAISTTRSKK